MLLHFGSKWAAKTNQKKAQQNGRKKGAVGFWNSLQISITLICLGETNGTRRIEATYWNTYIHAYITYIRTTTEKKMKKKLMS